MPCLFPLKGWKAKSGGFTRSLSESPEGVPMTIACGHCRECRLARSRDWGVRVFHDMKAARISGTGNGSCFLTLTLEDGRTDDTVGLDPRMLTLFHKRANAKFGGGLRYFSCGEYGDSNLRPHYHCIFTNRDFGDRVHVKDTAQGDKLYTSKTLDELWPFGKSWIGEVTFKSAAYVARYVMKKAGGPLAAERYKRINDDRSVRDVAPEFVVMSRRPGIGRPFFDLFGKELIKHQTAIVDGHELPIPRYYLKLFEAQDPEGYEALMEQRKASAAEFREQHPEEQLHLRRLQLERHKELQAARLKRSL